MYKKYVASALLVFMVLFSYQTAHASFLGDVWGGLKTVVSGNHQNLRATVVGGTKLAPIATPPIVEPTPSTTVLDTIPTDTTTPPILVPTKPCTITAFSATPSAISVGDTTSLSWKTTNCTSVTLDGATVATTGTQSTGVLSASKTYTLVARARESVQSLKTTVTVNPVITPTATQDDTTATPQQASTTTTAIDTTPRIAYWWGKVNQHIDTQGNWQTDTDGWSGASLDELTYCKKFYPNTTSVAPYKSETITTFRRASGYEQSGYTNTVTSVQCVQNGIVVTTPVVNTSPTTPILTSPTNDEPIPHTPRTIESGATGNDVKDIQTKLKEQGFLTAKPSGSFGTKTKSAVKKFQKANDLPVTGIVDQATLDTLSGTAARQGSGTPVITPNPIPNPTTVLCSITNLSAKPAVITTGKSSTIAWTTAGCSSATINGTTVATNGSQSTGALAATTSYTLVATGTTGTQTKGITIIVNTPPITITSPNGGETYTDYQTDGNLVYFKWTGVNIPYWTSSMTCDLNVYDANNNFLGAYRLMNPRLYVQNSGQISLALPSLAMIKASSPKFKNAVFGKHFKMSVLVTNSVNGQDVFLGSDDSDDFFSINQAPLAISSPNGGEVYTGGQQVDIKWDTTLPASDTIYLGFRMINSSGTGVNSISFGLNSIAGAMSTPISAGHVLITMPTLAEIKGYGGSFANATAGKHFKIDATAISSSNARDSYDTSDEYFTIN